VREGDRQHRARLDGFHEISTLSASLNTMLDGIERSQGQLDEQREAHAALETRLHRSETLAGIGALAAGVAHELGTPLSVVHGRAQRLLRDRSLADGTARSVREIQDQVRRMEAIVRQLLEFGRRRSTESRLTSVADVVERAAASVSDLASGTDVAFTQHVAEHGACPLEDPAGLELAVSNLLRNAIQAAPGGLVALSASTPQEAVRIVVDDNGPGVPDAIRPRVFEPFFTTKPVGQGTGLGLALARRMISEMGGVLDVETSPLGGARFTITVPAAAAPAAEERRT
jgi:signal transduction histidine kinase